MSDTNKEKAIKDKMDMRSGIDRRKFEYSACIPERRAGKDRRIPIAQENGPER
jgi:hypothetical protein